MSESESETQLPPSQPSELSSPQPSPHPPQLNWKRPKPPRPPRIERPPESERATTPMETPVRALIVCVEYADILALTLPHNAEFLSEVMIVSTETDFATRRLAKEFEIPIHLTNVFYRRGAHFNRFAAIEEGLNVFGRHGWLLLLDADIAIPKFRHPFTPVVGRVYTPYRRVLKVHRFNPSEGLPEQHTWAGHKRPLMKDEQSGYFQLFHASDPALGRPPWHSLDWTWAGNADVAFQNRWQVANRVRPPFEVLHIGVPKENWTGRVSPFLDGSVHPDAEVRKDHREMLLRSRIVAGKVDINAKEKLK